MVRDTPPSQDALTNKLGSPTLNNIGDMHQTGSGKDKLNEGRRDGQCDYYVPPKVLLGHN